MNEEWVKVVETTVEDEILECLKKMCDERNIKYKVDLIESWDGWHKALKYNGTVVVYVDSNFESEVETFLNEYYNKNCENNLVNDVQELQETQENQDTKNVEYNIEEERKQDKNKALIGFIIAMLIYVIAIIVSRNN